MGIKTVHVWWAGLELKAVRLYTRSDRMVPKLVRDGYLANGEYWKVVFGEQAEVGKSIRVNTG